jgi:hypothetical protein
MIFRNLKIGLKNFVQIFGNIWMNGEIVPRVWAGSGVSLVYLGIF